jgi:DNA-binding transcriptional regulator YiaG
VVELGSGEPGYVLTNADGRGLYIKLKIESGRTDEVWVLSFHVSVHHKEQGMSAENPTETDARCPTCNVGRLCRQTITDRFEYEADGEKVTVVANGVPVRVCDNPSGGEGLSGPEAARIWHEAICRALRLLTPAEIQGNWKKLGLSEQQFAELTGIGTATLSRWGRGRLLQNRAMDNYLRLVAHSADNVHFLQGLRAPGPGEALVPGEPLVPVPLEESMSRSPR